MTTPGSSAWREQYWGKGCDTSVIVSTYWIIGAPKIQLHRNVVRLARAVGRVMQRYLYHINGETTGGYNCRKITGGTVPSAHAQGIAWDVNWDTNPYRKDRLVTDMSVVMTDEIQNLANDAGVKCCRWGGDWDHRPEMPNSNYDAMHFECIGTPFDMKVGFSIPSFDETNSADWPLLALHEKGDAVRQLQAHLNQESSLILDGYYGPFTEQAVKGFQYSRGLQVDGVVGRGTWTALLSSQPILSHRDVPPNKGLASNH